MTLTFTGTYKFDTKAERKRIAKCFRGPKWKGARDRQRAILDAVDAGDLGKAGDLYNALPRCAVKGYKEQEYVGLWMPEIIGILQSGRYNITEFHLTKD